MFSGRFGRKRAARMAIRSEHRVAGEACALEPLLCRRTANGAPRSPVSGGSPNNSAGAYPSTGQTSQCCSERVPLGRHEDALAGHQAGSRVEGSDKAAYRSGATGNFSPTGSNMHTSCQRGVLELTRLRGHLTVVAGGVHDGRQDGPVCAGSESRLVRLGQRGTGFAS